MIFTWSEAVKAVKESTWRTALEACDGNITRAARSLGIHRVHGAKLTKKFNLSEYACELRRNAGAPSVGRPPKTKSME